MRIKYTYKEKLFMWRCQFMYSWYSFWSSFAGWWNWYILYTKWSKTADEWYERGWEVSMGF
jgi:hypothetical protein